MNRLSASQQLIVDKMLAGARLCWLSERGLFRLEDGPTQRTVDPRTVEALVKAQAIEKDMVGGCRVVTPPAPSVQADIEFADNRLYEYAEHAPGTWLRPDYTTPDFIARLFKAMKSLHKAEEHTRDLFDQGIRAARTLHRKMLLQRSSNCSDADSWWTPDFTVNRRELATFVAHCLGIKGVDQDGVEYKSRKDSNGLTTGVFVPDVGSVVVFVRIDRKQRMSVEYFPYRDSFFLPSYRDSMPLVYSSRKTWEKAYCADKLAYSGAGIMSLRSTFKLNGYEYINTGSVYSGSYADCIAWTFCDASLWKGPTYSYEAKCKSWDEGRSQRGDERGLLIKVRGKLSVLTSAAIVYDDKVK